MYSLGADQQPGSERGRRGYRLGTGAPVGSRAGRYGQSEYNQILGRETGHAADVLSPNKDDKKNDVFNSLGPVHAAGAGSQHPLWTFGKLDAALHAAQAGFGERTWRTATPAAPRSCSSTKQLYYGLLLSRQLALVLHDMLHHGQGGGAGTSDAGSISVTEIDLLSSSGRAKFCARAC